MTTRTAPSRAGRPAAAAPGGSGRDLITVAAAALLVGAAVLVGRSLLQHGVKLHVSAPPLTAAWLPHAGQAVVALAVNHLLLTGW